VCGKDIFSWTGAEEMAGPRSMGNDAMYKATYVRGSAGS